MTTKTPPVRFIDVYKIFFGVVKAHPVSFFLSVFGVLGFEMLAGVTPLIYQKMVTAVSTLTNTEDAFPVLMPFVYFLLGVGILSWILHRVDDFSESHHAVWSATYLREKAFSYSILHSHAFFSDAFTGALVQKINRLARSYETIYSQTLRGIFQFIVWITTTVVVLSLMNVWFAVVIVVWVIACVLFQLWYSKYATPVDVAAAEIDSKATGQLADAISNHSVINMFFSHSRERKAFAKVSREQARAQYKAYKYETWGFGIMYGASPFIQFLLFVLCIYFFQNGIVALGTFVILQSYILSLDDRLWIIGAVVRRLRESYADAKQAVEILLLPHEVSNVPGAKELTVTTGDVVFEKVSFSFNETREVIPEFSLHIAAGKKYALVGESGAGKSTLVRLLLRLYDVTSGKILIDGQTISQVTLESLRNAIGFVPQDTTLFHRSIYENIHYGNPKATKEEVYEAARLAHCDEFIERIPEKYNALVGERGVKLSGGERQRIAIARAILKNAPILILDEATSSLDSHSESLIQDALENLMKGKTVIVIAHRLSTIRKMDRIVVLAEGKILEEGTHDELIGKDGSLYAKLWSLQAGGFLKAE